MRQLIIPAALAATAIPAAAQAFPFVPLTEPVYPYADPDFGWTEPDAFDHGTLQRLGDLNNDGVKDLVVLFDLDNSYFGNPDELPRAWVFPGDAEGGFSRPEPINFTISAPIPNYDGHPVDFVVFDHNADGNTDLVFVNDAGTVVPCLRTGEQFEIGQTIPSHLQEGDPYCIKYSAANTDAIPDLIVWSPDRMQISIRLGKAAGYSGQASVLSSAIFDESSMAAFRFTDTDADGDLDVLLTDGARTYVYKSVESGYAAAQELNFDITNFTLDSGYPQPVFNTLADVNADGHADIVVYGEPSPDKRGFGFILAPFVNGETREIPSLTLPNFESERLEQIAEVPDSWARRLTSPGDLDGDGTEDLILKPYEHYDTAWRITDPLNHNGRFGISSQSHLHGDGYFDGGPAQLQRPRWQYAYRDAYADINNDGALDIVTPIAVRDYVELHHDDTTNDHNGIMLAAMLGNPFTPRVVLDEQESIYSSVGQNHLIDADLNNDDSPEILQTRPDTARPVRRLDNGLWDYSRNPGDTYFRYGAGFRSAITQLNTDARVEVVSMGHLDTSLIPAVFVDVDMPGFDDMYLPDSLENLVDFESILDNAGLRFSCDTSSFAVVDVDADGDNDILIRGLGGPKDKPPFEAVLVWLNDGEANFTPGPLSPVEPYGDNSVHLITTIDADNDGDPDLASIQGADGESPIIGIYLNDGAGNFTPSHTVQVHDYVNFNLRQYWIEACDIDLDGYDDLMVLTKNTVNQTESEVVLLYGSPDGLSTQPVYLPGRGAAEVHCADLDGNGLPDLYTCSYESNEFLKNSLSIMFQTAPRQFLPAISIHDLHMSAAHAFDMNDDGALDLLGGGNESRDMRVFYSVPTPCTGDLNLDGELDFFDINLFIRLFTEERPIADLNRDGVNNFFDFSDLIKSFRNGCP